MCRFLCVWERERESILEERSHVSCAQEVCARGPNCMTSHYQRACVYVSMSVCMGVSVETGVRQKQLQTIIHALYIYCFIRPPTHMDVHTKTHAHKQTSSLPTSASRVKCYSLLVVTVANHITFCSNCFHGNWEIGLPGTESNAWVVIYLISSLSICSF